MYRMQVPLIGRHAGIMSTIVLSGGLLISCQSQPELSTKRPEILASSFTPQVTIQGSTIATDATFYGNRGVRRLLAQNLGGAIEDFREAIKRDPEEVQYHVSLGWALVQAKDFRAGLASLDYAVGLKGASHEAFLRRGDARVLLKDYSGAIQDYSEALNRFPAFYQAAAQRAYAYAMLGQYTVSLEEYTKLIDIRPTPELYSARATINVHLKDWLRAADDYTHAINLNPTHTPYLLARARVKTHVMDFQGALRDLDQAVSISPKDVNSYLFRSTILRALGKLEEAQKDVDEAVRLDPSLRSRSM